jgi:hypothetical protein
MATTISAFNDMMQQFLDELVLTFPETKSFSKFQSQFKLLRKTSPRTPMNNFMESITPYANSVMQRDEKFFKEHADTIPFLKSLDINSIWTDDLSDSTKSAIWQYLQTLYILGTTISTLPAETLNMIESVAQKCASQMTENASGLDEKVLLENMSGLMSSLMSPDAMKKFSLKE